MRLNHRQLEAFRAVFTSGSVTDAAAQMCITQPAVSRLLSDLEGEIGFKLFVREKRRLTPTTEGMALFDEVERSFMGLDVIRYAAEEIGEYRRGSLRISCMPAMALSFLPRVITEYCVERPRISVALHIHSSQRVLQHIATQQFDLGFSSLTSPHSGVISVPFFEAPLVAVLKKGHRLAKKRSINAKDFKDETFISLGTNYPTRQLVDAVFIAAGVRPKSAIETQLSFSVGQLVSQGAGVSLIEPVTADEMSKLGLIEVRRFEPPIMYKYFMVAPSLRPKSMLSESFVSIVASKLKNVNDGALLFDPKK